MPVEKTISALDARRKLGQLLEEVFYQGNQFIIERAGRPMAVVVPLSQYRRWQERKERFFAMVEEVRERNRGTPPEVIEAEVEEAVRALRGERAGRREGTL